MDARLSAKKTVDAQNIKSAGMTAGGLRMKQALACNNIQVIPECFNWESRKIDWITDVFITIVTYAVLRKNGNNLFSKNNFVRAMLKRYV
jgi:hypothetical protein